MRNLTLGYSKASSWHYQVTMSDKVIHEGVLLQPTRRLLVYDTKCNVDQLTDRSRALWSTFDVLVSNENTTCQRDLRGSTLWYWGLAWFSRSPKWLSMILTWARFKARWPLTEQLYESMTLKIENNNYSETPPQVAVSKDFLILDDLVPNNLTLSLNF